MVRSNDNNENTEKNYFLNDIVLALLEEVSNLNDFYTERNNIKRQRPFLFFLTPLCSKLGIYSEIDLLLLVFGCKIKLVLDVELYPFGFYFPRDFTHVVVVKLHKSEIEEKIIVETETPLLFEMGQITVLEEYLNQLVPNLLVNFPKEIKYNDDNEDHYQDDFKEYKGQLNSLYDIDGVFGIIPYHIDDPFLLSLTVDLNMKANNRTLTKKFYLSGVKINKCPSIKIGYITSHLGNISLFFVFNNGVEVDRKLFMRNLSVILEEKYTKDQVIKAYVSRDNIKTIFKSLKELYPEGIFFIEIYGCKFNTFSKVFSKVFILLNAVFCDNLIPCLNYDVAISVAPTEKKAIFLKESLLVNTLHLKGNYRLGFSTTMVNYHGLKAGKEDNYTHNYGCVKKINFYSLLEDMVVGIRKMSYLPTISLKRAANCLEGWCFKSYEEITYSKKISLIEDGMNSKYRLGYRLEMTVQGAEVGSVMNVLFALIRNSNFVSIDYKRFKFLYLSNLNLLNSFIVGDSIDDLINNIVAECLLKEFYIKGTEEKHFFPSSFKVRGMYRSGLPVFSYDLKEVIKISRDEGLLMICKMLENKQYPITQKGFDDILLKFVNIYRSNNPVSCFKLVYDQYITDYSEYYEISTINRMNYNLLGQEFFSLINEMEDFISANYFISVHLLGERSKFAYRFLFLVVKKHFNMFEEDLVNYIYSMLIRHGLNIGFIHRNKPFENKSLLCVIDFEGGHTGPKVRSSLLQLLKEEQKNYALTSSGPKKKWTTDEQVKLLNGIMRYGNVNPNYSAIYQDIVYGFYLSRPFNNALADSYRTFKNKLTFLFIRNALNWMPHEHDYEVHLAGLSLENRLREVYVSVFSLDFQAFRPIDRENFSNFVENHLGNKNLLTNSQYEECLRIVNGRTTRRERVRSVEYVPFDIVHQDVVVFESCPPTPFAPEPILEIPRRPVILDYTKCDGCKKVEERLENIEYIVFGRKNSIIYEEEQFKDIIHEEKQVKDIIQEEQFNDIIQEEQFEDIIQEEQFKDIIDEPKITESKWSDVEEEQMFNVWVEGKVSNDKNVEDNDEDEIEVVCKINKEITLKKMRNIFKRKNFTVSQVRNSCFFSNSRPMKEEIEDFLNDLTNEGILMKNPKSGNKESWFFTKK